MAFYIEAKEIYLRSSNCQKNRVKREALDSHQIRVNAWYSSFLQRFRLTFDVAMAGVANLHLKRDLRKKKRTLITKLKVHTKEVVDIHLSRKSF